MAAFPAAAASAAPTAAAAPTTTAPAAAAAPGGGAPPGTRAVVGHAAWAPSDVARSVGGSRELFLSLAILMDCTGSMGAWIVCVDGAMKPRAFSAGRSTRSSLSPPRAAPPSSR